MESDASSVMGSPEPWAASSRSAHDAADEEIAAEVIHVFDLDRCGGRECRDSCAGDR